MPGYLVTSGTTILCAHGGKITAPAVNPRVKVQGQPTVFQSGPGVVAGCAFPPPPAGNGPCVTAPWINGTTRVTSMKQPLLAADVQAVCVPTGTPVSVIPGQARVKGM
jgi:hypothetical protein